MKKLGSKRTVEFILPFFAAGMATAFLACGQSASGPSVLSPEESEYARIRDAYDSSISSGPNQSKWIPRATAQCDSFLTAHPGSRRVDDVTFFKGHILFEAAKYEEAKSSLRAVLAILSDSSRIDDAEYYLARSLFEQDSLAAAQELFTGFEKKFPASVQNAPALYYAGLSAFKRGLPDVAQTMFQKVLDRYPTSLKRDDAQYFLARTLNDRKMYPEALAAFRALYLAAPTGPYADNALYYQGSVTYSLKDYAGCITIMRDFLSRFASSIHADNGRYFIGKSLYQLGRPAEAEPEFQNVADMSPPGNVSHYALYYLARIRLDASDCAGAAVPIRRLRGEYPGSTPLGWAEARAAAKGCAIP